MSLIEKLPPDFYRFSYLGSSVENRSIYGLELGHGSYKIMAWSQMHGNESTTTRALIQLLSYDNLDEILKDTRLYIIPVLNPDGATHWTRNNACGIDLNRDATNNSQPEMNILRDIIEFYEPDLALNLHDQRSIYGTATSPMAAPLSFLAPAADPDRLITPARLKAMSVINTIVDVVNEQVPGQIGRYSDTFNADCIGDYCQSQGIPTILFEAGHSDHDYNRDKMVGIISEALRAVFAAAPKDQVMDESAIVSDYDSIPNVVSNYCDILIRNYPEPDSGRLVNLSIMFHEQVEDEQLFFVPMLYGINVDHIHYAHKTIDCSTNDEFKDDLIISDAMQVSSASLGIGVFAN
jgi:hypothetical protein